MTTNERQKQAALRSASPAGEPAQRQQDAALKPYYRAENEDDDGYDPYSDRPAAPEPLFERDPWS